MVVIRSNRFERRANRGSGVRGIGDRDASTRSSPTPDSRHPTPHSDVRRLSDEANRWLVAEGELRAMLNGVAGANLVRRQRIALIAGQAFNIGTQGTRSGECRPRASPAGSQVSEELQAPQACGAGSRDAGTGSCNAEDTTSARCDGQERERRVQARPVISPLRRGDDDENERPRASQG